MKRNLRWVSVGCAVAFVAALSGAGPSGAATVERTIQARDDCDPATFNAAVGPGTCVGNGHISFDRFIKEMQVLGLGAPSWLFLPRQLDVKTGESFLVENVGGEFHTFTEVAEFGGGVVPILNQLSNSGPVVPECLAPGVPTTSPCHRVPGPIRANRRPASASTCAASTPGCTRW